MADFYNDDITKVFQQDLTDAEQSLDEAIRDIRWLARTQEGTLSERDERIQKYQHKIRERAREVARASRAKALDEVRCKRLRTLENKE
jgi:hypothetical protein